MRLFIAVNIPKRSKNLIKNRVDKIKSEVSENVKWVKPKNWHLTLKFLGDVDQNKISDIKDSLNFLEAKFTQFPVKFRSIGAFPGLNHPRVVFIQIEKGENKLIDLHHYLDKKMQNLGFDPEDKSYHPHLTIARSRDSTDKKKFSNNLNQFSGKNFINVYMEVNKVSLMESELFSEGPVYKEKHQVLLYDSK